MNITQMADGMGELIRIVRYPQKDDRLFVVLLRRAMIPDVAGQFAEFSQDAGTAEILAGSAHGQRRIQMLRRLAELPCAAGRVPALEE